MDIIVFKNELYTLYPLDYDFDFTILSFFEYCDAFRKAMSTYNDELNKWIMNNGTGIWFGCIAS